MKKIYEICGNIILLDSFVYKILYQSPIHSQFLNKVAKLHVNSKKAKKITNI
jgi:hypothetical protein